ncbi:MAG: prephenate dehydrogenase/arogenate dehydrogenase family protein [Candidatus Limnocylindrales bacterium]
MRVSIVGFGLIGGSIARALRERAEPGGWTVAVWSRNAGSVKRALEEGVVDRAPATLGEALALADLVVLAAPPVSCLELLAQIGGPLRGSLPDDCTVTDVASSKTRMVALADELKLPFIGGHPMAGREVGGYGAALPDLFVGRPWVTVLGRCARLGDGERVGEMIEACGAVQVPMHADAHDQAVAAISHMPLVVSAAIVEAVAGGPGELERADWRAAEFLSATGWAGMTRLARGRPDLGAGIAATNSDALATRLRDLRAVIDSWLAELERDGGPDVNALLARFESARQRLIDADRR